MSSTSDSNIALLQRVRSSVLSFQSSSFEEAAIRLLSALGYASEKVADMGRLPETFLASIEGFNQDLGPINRIKIRASDWKSCAFLFQLTNDEIPMLAMLPGQVSFVSDRSIVRSQIESFVFLAIDLKGDNWSRSDLAAISREINRRFPMPVIILFRYDAMLSMAVIDRRVNNKDAARDVIDGRITVIKDVRIDRPHRAHIEILSSLAIEALGEQHRPTNFVDLYRAWIQVLSTQALNKRFYTELSYWYFWAVKQVDFPVGGGLERSKRNSVAVIRLLTRVIFVWFIREKGLVPDDFFDREKLSTLLKSDPSNDREASNYYLAILQNLFFATLNVEMGEERKWAASGGGMKGDRFIYSLYRHKELFTKPDAALELFKKVPYLNGGLFECLDRELSERDLERNPELKRIGVKEGNGWVLRVDGFSRRNDAQPRVPNKIFFGGQENIDLSADLGPSKKPRSVDGLLDIFSKYKFTVDENTPVEEEVALDPELLGKVFENLLASYNEDTSTTARKLSGSFYTPREVVDYMVDEALIASLENHLSLGDAPGIEGALSLTERLRDLLSFTTDAHKFSSHETRRLIAAIESLKILDPACGSGAFPMGALTKLVHVLKKLDPKNAMWRQQNRKPLEEQQASASKIPDLTLREDKVFEAEEALRKLDRDFHDAPHADYSRKLYLIEKCIHGVDIQPIAVQIAKLRFFISLIVSQEVDSRRENWGITALPNLETKIVAADSLTPIDRPQQLLLRDAAIDVKERELVAANEYYFAARTAKTKRKWRERIFDLRDELALLLEKDLFLSAGAAKQLVHWNPFDQNASADFFDPEWMFQIKDGFDVVIGNPPYVRQEKIEVPSKSQLRQQYQCFSGAADLFVYFYERSIKLLKPHGGFAFITSNKWYRSNYGEKLRDFMNRNTRLRTIIDFGDAPVFDAIAYPTIVIATRREREVSAPASTDVFQALNWAQGPPVETFPTIFASHGFEMPQTELRKEGWQLEPPTQRLLLDHLRTAGMPLGEFVDRRLYRGILTGFNDAFVISGTVRSALIEEDARSAEIIKPFLRGRDVKRWHVEPEDLWLIFTRRGVDINQYPSVLKHLKRFKKELMPKPDGWDDTMDDAWPGRKSGSYKWYEIQDNIAYWEEFEQPKIFVPAIEDGVEYAHDLLGYYGNDKTNIIVTEEWRYVLAILNSSISWWITQQTFSGKQGGFYEFKPMYVSQLPIPPATPKTKTLLEIVVDCVLATRDYHFDQLINGLVFELFFPKVLHGDGIHLFNAIEKANIQRLAALEEGEFKQAAEKLATQIFANSHPIYGMLFDLQALDVVRLIEGRE